jgi:hypothetical protein
MVKQNNLYTEYSNGFVNFELFSLFNKVILSEGINAHSEHWYKKHWRNTAHWRGVYIPLGSLGNKRKGTAVAILLKYGARWIKKCIRPWDQCYPLP